jgi:sulfate transport system permease protein
MPAMMMPRPVGQPKAGRPATATAEPVLIRWLLIGVCVVFLSLFLLLPLVAIFVQAFSAGWRVYLHWLTDRNTLAAIRLTLITACIAVPLNAVFAVAAAWCIAKFEFLGKSLLVTLIELPLAIPPAIAGLIFILLFGHAGGGLGPWLNEHHVNMLFAVPGIIVVTIFVTVPYVACALIPLMQAQGSDEEQAARASGASGWQIFSRITLPNIKWGLLYGVTMCNARAMGEYGAVALVSGNVVGLTNTMPLHVQFLYDGAGNNHVAAAFAVASLLAFLALVTLLLKSLIERETASTTLPVDELPFGEP